MTDNTPTFHHLNHAQSQRIFWLLEELSIPYKLKMHERNPPNHPTAPFGAPPSLQATGPYAKAPLLITGPKDGNRYIPESLAITTYLIRTFDTSDSFGLKNGDYIRDEVLVSLITTELGFAMGITLKMDLGLLANGPQGNIFDGPALRKVLGDLERELKEGPKGGYFMGEKPGRPDIMLEFPLSVVKHRGWVDLEKEFPELDKWMKRVYEREAFKRSIEKGNGYDYAVFPKLAHLTANL